ncbi:hypothetical protein [Pseudomarimonas arenosa]|uniref:Uncharacterized protein n=1 Tax=Pseudomarimonas arenosa TaxID=2774145 RepID=A0AAW3ZQP7_9GAMM|nr:hypothetical protein [Pseudomarimonas arenosa]MBD8527809.1 hypothetical protein [Pseudomarimonas arenosa]
MNGAAPSIRLRGFWPEILLGLALSLAAAAVFQVTRGVFGSADALRLILLGCAAGYSLWILRIAEAKVGRLVAFAAFAVLALVLMIWNPTAWTWIGSLLGFNWLLRCLYRHDSLLAAITDAGLSMLALTVGIASLQHTQSLWIGFWCFFLTQALHHAIPKGWGARPARLETTHPNNTPFNQAFRASEAAFSRLASRR